MRGDCELDSADSFGVRGHTQGNTKSYTTAKGHTTAGKTLNQMVGQTVSNGDKHKLEMVELQGA